MESSREKSPLLWTWEVQVDYEIWVRVYTKNKGAIATRGRNREKEGHYSSESADMLVYVELPSVIMSIDMAFRSREKSKVHK